MIARQFKESLPDHPAKEFAANFGSLTCIPTDASGLSILLAYCAARFGRPINVAIATDAPSVDLAILETLARVRPQHTRRIDRLGDAKAFAACNFGLEGPIARPVDLLTVVANEPVFQYLALETSRLLSVPGRAPSVVYVSSTPLRTRPVGPTLSLTMRAAERELEQFPDLACLGAADDVWLNMASRLADLFERPHRPKSMGLHSAAWRAGLQPDDAVLAERLLHTLAAIRVFSDSEHAHPESVCVDGRDYKFLYHFVRNGPVTPLAVRVSPAALQTAGTIWSMIQRSKWQKSIPDRSDLGSKLFTRRDAEQFTKSSYNTVKSHLAELEHDGLVESTLAVGERSRGRQIFFSMPNEPVLRNPLNLPCPTSVAADCNRLLQSQCVEDAGLMQDTE